MGIDRDIGVARLGKRASPALGIHSDPFYLAKNTRERHALHISHYVSINPL